MELFVLVVAIFVGGLFAIAIALTRRAMARSRAAFNRADAVARTLQNAAGGEYIASSHVQAWVTTCGAPLVQEMRLATALWLSRTQRAELPGLRLVRDDPAAVAELWNEAFVDQRMEQDAKDLVDSRGRELSRRQQQAVVRDASANLVIAGAGSGKTETMVAKTAYLMRHELALPGEILVLAYGKKAAEELSERLIEAKVSGVTASTSHALGYTILGHGADDKPPISALAEDKIAALSLIGEQIKHLLRDAGRQHLVTSMLADHLYDNDPAKTASNGDEYHRELRNIGLRCINNTLVKSGQEVKIGNWLTLNGFEWEYERRYPHTLAAPLAKQAYTPDFYLPQHDIWIEHFGIDLNGKTARWVNNAAYLRGMKFKREVHKKYNTALIETFSWEDWEGSLLTGLRRKLAARHAEVRPLGPEELADLEVRDHGKAFDRLRNLLLSFLRLFRGSTLQLEDLAEQTMSPRDAAFLALFEPVLQSYLAALDNEGKIDFDHMIELAIERVESGQAHVPWRYILVDEFQDISRMRLKLLEALQARHVHGRLFCVGDDWQSIYRFTGADVSLFTGLQEHVGPVRRTYLDLTYRCSQPLVDVSSAFITRNPAQLKKEVRSMAALPKSSPVMVVLHAAGQAAIDEAIRICLDDMAVVVRAEPPKQGGARFGVLVLGRYKHSRPDGLAALEDAAMDHGVEIRHMTVHGSKGLEDDFVLVVGNESGRYGFPAQISDDPTLSMLLADRDDFPHAEERRLFYVALTRARRRVYLLALSDKPSTFVQEFIESAEEWNVELVGKHSERYRCPFCQAKTVRRKVGPYGEFWSCLHFPRCEGKLHDCDSCRVHPMEPVFQDEEIVRWRCAGCGELSKTCPRCGWGWPKTRIGKAGPFKGCTRWRKDQSGCDYIE